LFADSGGTGDLVVAGTKINDDYDCASFHFGFADEVPRLREIDICNGVKDFSANYLQLLDKARKFDTNGHEKMLQEYFDIFRVTGNEGSLPEGEGVHFEIEGRMTILSRGVDGRITQMTDGSQIYSFTYDNQRLTGVDVSPVPPDVLPSEER
jgi:hypothetical protein